MRYTQEYLNGLTREQVLELMHKNGYAEGYEDLDTDQLIEQLSTIVST